MKFNLIPIFIMMMLATGVAQAQDKKVKEVSFQVDGVCKMCKTRIEDAALYTKGVKFAEWNKETKTLKVAFRTDKTDEVTVHKSIAEAGHDTPEVKATEEAYAKLPGCCKYRDGVETH
jgi:cation transport ATPase